MGPAYSGVMTDANDAIATQHDRMPVSVRERMGEGPSGTAILAAWLSNQAESSAAERRVSRLDLKA